MCSCLFLVKNQGVCSIGRKAPNGVQHVRSTVLMSTDSTFNPSVPSLSGVPYRIGQIVPRDRIECIRVRYLTVATEQIAKECRSMLSSGQVRFSDLVRSLSLDQLTRETMDCQVG